MGLCLLEMVITCMQYFHWNPKLEPSKVTRSAAAVILSISLLDRGKDHGSTSVPTCLPTLRTGGKTSSLDLLAIAFHGCG